MSSNEENYRYTSAPERRERLVQFIAAQGYCTIAELSRAFAVSEMTIRRDVLRLVEQGKVRGFRGGVGSVSPQDLEGSDYSHRDLKMADAKRAIAMEAVAMIPPVAAIALDAGTTTNQVAKMLPSDRNIKVVTNSFTVVSSLVRREGVEVVCLGGTLHPVSLSFDGPETLAAIANLHLDTLFLAATGLSDRGAFCGNGFDAITKRALIDVAESVVLVADSSKFDSSALVRICGWESIDRLIIDDGIQPEHEQMLAQYDLEVVKVPVNADTGDENSAERGLVAASATAEAERIAG